MEEMTGSDCMNLDWCFVTLTCYLLPVWQAWQCFIVLPGAGLSTHLAVRVDIDPLIIIAQQELHPVSVGQRYDGVRSYGALGVFGHVDVVHTGIL